MNTAKLATQPTLAAILGLVFWGCSGASGSATAAGGFSTAAGNTGGGAPSAGTSNTGANVGGNAAVGGSAALGGAPSTGGTPAAGGAAATGGASFASGGAPTGGAKSASGGAATGGVKSASGGAVAGGGTSAASTGGAATASTSGACTMGTWPTADPSKTGPFAVQTDNNVGPQAGEADDAGVVPQFTMFRPQDMAQGGLCHPVITWGNGTGSNPSLYKSLLGNLASHGFVVIASNSPNVSKGTPEPMIAGVTWVIAQNADPTSVLYQRIDTTHVGATGHSQGAFATTTAGADSHITTIAPICGAMAQKSLHGPALLLCGGQDTTVPCDTIIQPAFQGITNQPAMLAEYLAADHISWVTFAFGTSTTVTLSPMETAVVAWMRVQLMGDTTLSPMFYGADCTLCQDAAWQITKNSLMN